jgi:hypothetical protein
MVYGLWDKRVNGRGELKASRRERMPAQQAGQEVKGEWEGEKRSYSQIAHQQREHK